LGKPGAGLGLCLRLDRKLVGRPPEVRSCLQTLSHDVPEISPRPVSLAGALFIPQSFVSCLIHVISRPPCAHRPFPGTKGPRGVPQAAMDKSCWFSFCLGVAFVGRPTVVPRGLSFSISLRFTGFILVLVEPPRVRLGCTTSGCWLRGAPCGDSRSCCRVGWGVVLGLWCCIAPVSPEGDCCALHSGCLSGRVTYGVGLAVRSPQSQSTRRRTLCLKCFDPLS